MRSENQKRPSILEATYDPPRQDFSVRVKLDFRAIFHHGVSLLQVALQDYSGPRDIRTPPIISGAIFGGELTYPEALASAKDFLSEQRSFGDYDLYDPQAWREFDLANSAMGAKIFHLGANLGEGYLSKFAKGDASENDIARRILAGMVKYGEPLSSELRELAAAFIRGEGPTPVRNAGRKTNPFLRTRIAMAVAILVHVHGLTATRNDGSSQTTSACDAVADALRELELTPKEFNGVKQIWLEYRQSIFVELNFD